MDLMARAAAHHERRAAIWLATGVALSMVIGLTLAFGFDIDDSPAPLLAWVGSWGAAWHLYQRARLQGRRACLLGGFAMLGPVPAILVHLWLRGS